jgi:peptidoglycan/LPS O-acetylase OafA/YrhL
VKTSVKSIHWESLAVLRFLLAWIVFSGHLNWFTGYRGWAEVVGTFDGKAAVVGFLLVSGYSIAASLDREREGFYRRRFLRVYPLYFVAVIFAIVLEAWTGGHLDLPPHTLDSFGWVTALGNLLLLQTFAVKPIQFNGPVWSLSVEVFYYLLAPLFARLPRNGLLAIIACSSVCYALPKHTDWGFIYLVLSKLNALEYMWCWLLGFLLWRDRSPLTIALALVGIPQMIFGDNTAQPLAVVTYTVTLVLLIAGGIRVPERLKSFADYLGDLSYPLYLFHYPTLIFGILIFGPQLPGVLVLMVGFFTVAAFHLIDRYLKRKYIIPLVFSPSGTRCATPSIRA